MEVLPIGVSNERLLSIDGTTPYIFNGKSLSGPDLIPAISDRPSNWLQTNVGSVNFYSVVLAACCYIGSVNTALFLRLGRAQLEFGCNCTNTIFPSKVLQFFDMKYDGVGELKFGSVTADMAVAGMGVEWTNNE